MRTSLFLAASMIANGIIGIAPAATADVIAPIGTDQYL